MQCERCGLRPATISFTQVINGVKSEAHLCGECAAELGDFGLGTGLELSFQNFLTGLLNQGLWQHKPVSLPNEKICHTCGLTYDQFSESGRLGCADCYDEFGQELDQLLRRIQGGTEHQGKIPSQGGKEAKISRKLQNLQAELKQAIAEENYERAAELRDSIQALKKEGGE